MNASLSREPVADVPEAPSNLMDTIRTSQNSRITICQVLHSLNVGGAEMLAYRLAQQLSDRFRFVFACLDDLGPLGKDLRKDGHRVEVLSRRPGFDWGCARKLSQYCRREHVQLIHAHQYTPFFYSVVPTGWTRRPPVLFTEHGRWYPDLPSRKRMLFNNAFLRPKDRVIGVGEHVRKALIDNEGIPAARVEVIYNGVDLRQFAREQTDRAKIRNALGLTPEEFVVIQVARLDGLKDHPTAVRTMEHLAQRIEHAKLLLVGEGPERAVIEQEIKQRGLERRIALLGTRSDIPQLLGAADAFLLTSISEGIPVTLIEAMGVGLPIVATRVGGVPEVIVDGETGLLASSGDDAALAHALIQLAEQPDLRGSFSDAGRRRAETMFSERRMHQAYEHIYGELSASKTAGH